MLKQEPKLAIEVCWMWCMRFCDALIVDLWCQDAHINSDVSVMLIFKSSSPTGHMSPTIRVQGHIWLMLDCRIQPPTQSPSCDVDTHKEKYTWPWYPIHLPIPTHQGVQQGGHFTHSLWAKPNLVKFHFALAQQIMIWSDYNFANVTTALLSWQVQICDLIWIIMVIITAKIILKRFHL